MSIVIVCTVTVD